ncbi:hypothetical protein [Segetibacter aerophilus]|uniref:Uncharacterized protein n=1 Tax=Segetibacter aerophilus TaxID=670293 RepID=A0A512BJF6_9BACT|nr:hypothetical protein [Segetibacter aerophilus]GEO12099.1 hypothetical protein SAE01_45950 [Segetibacter aerophilus]
MLTSTLNDTSSHPTNSSPNRDKNYDASVQKQIEQEEFNYRAAIQADKTFEEVKAIRNRINQLRKLLK